MLARSTTDPDGPDPGSTGPARDPNGQAHGPDGQAGRRGERKSVLVRMDPAVYDALARWASDELRSTTAQIELILRRALEDAGRLPPHIGAMPRRGRPPRT